MAIDSIIPAPSTDGGIEHTSARFLHPSIWLSQARSGSVVLFPPQWYLLHLLSPLLLPLDSNRSRTEADMEKQRRSVVALVESESPPFTEKCISPYPLLTRETDERSVFALERPGPELEGSERRGDSERVILGRFTKAGPRDLEVRWKVDVLQEERQRACSGKL